MNRWTRSAGSRNSVLCCLAFCTAFLLLPTRVMAFEAAAALGNLSITVYAPDWTWQNRDINLLVVARNAGALPQTLSLTLHWPEGAEDNFRYAGEPVKSVTIPPGGTERVSFAGITALVRGREYRFRLVASASGEEACFEYPVKTIRGAVLGSGNGALYLPAGIALAWCIAFAVLLRRFAAPGAWRKPGPPITLPENPPAWIHEDTPHA